MTRRPQRLLGDRYALGETIGVGGMAEVFLGLDTRLGREVAVKVLRIDLARDPLFQQRFRREAQAAASLNATCIVSVFDTGEDTVDGTRGVPWIVMEHVSGRTLRDVLRQEGPLPPERALTVTADVCEALEVAHAAGIVHRDIKPANVMLTPGGEVKVMDFGIARAVSAGTQTMTQTANVVGTAAYLSPEQALGEHVDARSDLYSTGCLLYELLTGGPPFTGDSPVSVAYQHVREDAARPSSVSPELGPQVDAVVLTALAKNPDNRYQSAAEMRADLLRAASGEAVTATPLLTEEALGGSGSTRLDPSRRGRGPYVAAAVLLLVVLAALGLLVRGLVGGPQRVSTPYVVGLAQSDAAAEITRARLKVGAVQQAFSDRRAGEVVGQTPSGGARVDAGRAVDLTVSKGVQTSSVPQVVGDTREQAQAELTQAGLVVGDVVEREGNAPPGNVLEVIPAAGTAVPEGGTVTLVVATGQVDVPLVVGLSQVDATARLQQAGFTVRVRQQAAPGRVGLVLSQDPANRTAARGSTVTLVVSIPPTPRRTTPAPTAPTAPPSPGPSSSPPGSPAPTTAPPTTPLPAPTTAPPTTPAPAPTTTPPPPPG